MPSLVVVVGVVEYQKSLDEGPRHIRCACHQGLPRNNCQPSCEVAQKFPARRRSQDSHPIKWAACERDPDALSAKAPRNVLSLPK